MKIKYIHDATVYNMMSAQKIVPFLISNFKISSVVDIGCGTGTWLRAFADEGFEDFLGIDGPHLDKRKLIIPEEKVLLLDLEKPFEVGRKFDLAISLEVAEHLELKVAQQFVACLANLSDVVLFSAAIPYQGGQNHVNEQWQGYWIDMFRQLGFISVDIIRPVFWNDQSVEFWYRQNIILFVKNSALDVKLLSLPSFHSFNIVHPELYNKKSALLLKIQRGEGGIILSIKTLIKSFVYALKR